MPELNADTITTAVRDAMREVAAPTIKRRFITLQEAATEIGMTDKGLLKASKRGDAPRLLRLTPRRTVFDATEWELWKARLPVAHGNLVAG